MQSLCQGTQERGTQFPDLEMVGFIKEVKFEADFEERVEIIQVARGPEWEQGPSGLSSPQTAGSSVTHQPRGR